MAEETPPVLVESIAPHTYDNIDRPVGSTYEAAAEHLEVLQQLGYALPPADAAARRAQLAPPEPEPPPPPKNSKKR